MANPYRILPGVYLLGGPEVTDRDDCCVYLVESAGQLAIIDAGVGFATEALLKNCRGFGFEPDHVRYLVATHGHIDHIGGLAFLRDNLAAPVVAHRLEIPALSGEKPELTAASYYGVGYRPVAVDMVVEGDKLELPLGELVLTCRHSPGHTPGSLNVWVEADGQQVVFAQDVHGPFRPEWGADLAAWQASMRDLLRRRPDVLCEGHFGVFRPAGRVRRYVQRCLAAQGMESGEED